MKKTKVFKKAISLFMIISLIAACGIGSIPSYALEKIDDSSMVMERESSSKNNSEFASKDLSSGEEIFYNMYKGSEKLDLSEETELSLYSDSRMVIKSNSGHFPINQASITNQPDINVKSVIGDDGRSRVSDTTVYPYSAICHISCRWPDGSTTTETAWMFWKNIAITAGHCVYSADRGGWATSIVLIPGANESYYPYGIGYGIRMHTSTEWYESANREYDFGVIELTSDIGNSCGWFGISWTIFTLWNTEVTIAGYPVSCNKQMWEMGGRINASDSRIIYYKIDTSDGQSGSPVFKSNNQVIAIHTFYDGTYNSATRITSAIFDYFSSFRQE